MQQNEMRYKCLGQRGIGESFIQGFRSTTSSTPNHGAGQFCCGNASCKVALSGAARDTSACNAVLPPLMATCAADKVWTS